ncbi:MAG: long-chain fatty acid--CoA ligase [Spirochaetes bacterium]|nr:long-chain fatty acid--CoA ligase [Spirochaetota bacterium]
MDYRTDTLCGLFHSRAVHYGDRFPFLTARYTIDGAPAADWFSITWQEAREQVLDFAAGLMALGVKPGDRVVIFSESIPHWIIVDQAIQATGAIGVPLYPTVSREELAYMLKDSGAGVVFAADSDKAKMVMGISRKKKPPNVIVMRPRAEGKKAGAYYFNDLASLGKKKVSRDRVEKQIMKVRPEDITSIIYTSGTTGKQKGVVLSQANWIVNMRQSSASELMMRAMDRQLHFRAFVHLPLCHVLGRTADYHVMGLYHGGELVFVENFQTLARDLREIRPNLITSIPRFFEKVYENVHSVMSRAKKPYRVIFNWAMKRGKRYSESFVRGRPIGLHGMLLFTIANILVFNRLKKEIGMDRLVMAISGGGKLNQDVCTFFRALGIQLMEGYGLTETSPVINMNTPDILLKKAPGKWRKRLNNWLMDMTIEIMIVRQSRGESPFLNPFSSLKLLFAYYALLYRMKVKPGTVGRVMPETEEIIAPDGEILVRGPQVFSGYWKKPNDTKDVFTADGFFKTGDIGFFDEDGFLVITDRKKELFVTSGGKNIAPHPIEVSLMERPYIDQACLVGDGRKYLAALIVPDFERLKYFAKNKRIAYSKSAELVGNAEVRAAIDREVQAVNASLARYEQIKYYTLLDTPFTIETGELTPTMKLKRRVVNEKYQGVIESMYNR